MHSECLGRWLEREGGYGGRNEAGDQEVLKLGGANTMGIIADIEQIGIPGEKKCRQVCRC